MQAIFICKDHDQALAHFFFLSAICSNPALCTLAADGKGFMFLPYMLDDYATRWTVVEVEQRYPHQLLRGFIHCAEI